MADYSAPVQTFSSPNYNVDPVVKRTGKGYTPLDMLEMVQTARGMTNLEKEQALLQPSIEAGKAATRSAVAGADTAEMNLALKTQQAIGSRYISMINNPAIIAAEQDPNKVDRKKLADDLQKWGVEQGKEAGVDAQKAAQLVKPYVDMAMNDPGALRTYLKERHILGLDAGLRTGAITPSGVAVNSGAGGAVVNTNPFAGPVGTAIPGTSFVQQLPPTTQLVASEGDGTGLPPGTSYFLGPQGQATPGNIPGGSARGASPVGVTAADMSRPKPIVSGLAPQTQNTLNVGADVSNKDWAQTYSLAKDAPNRIATLQNIKKAAPEAFTGVGGARKELATGIANAIGIDVFSAQKTATDELAKNSALLTLAGGNTDMARQIAEAANPNKKMTETAIKEMANQLIGMEKMNQVRASVLAPFQSNSIEYSKKAAEINPLMDYRLYQEYTKDDVAKLKASLSASEYKDFEAKLKKATSLGLIR